MFKKIIVSLFLTLALAVSTFGQTATPYGLSFPAGTLSVAEATQVINFKNTSGAILTGFAMTATGTNSADFGFAAAPVAPNVTACATSIAVNAACNITVTFTPGGLGARNGNLSIAYVGAAGSPLVLPLAGYGAASPGAAQGSMALMPLGFANAGATGTTLYSLAKLTGAPSTAVIATTADNKTGGVLGVVIAGAGITGSATILQQGQTLCNFDNSTVAGDFVTVSVSVNGDCADIGSTLPGDGSQVLGRAVSTNTGAGLYLVALTSGLGVSGGSGVAATQAAFTSAPTPSAAAGVTLGTALLPFGTVYFGTAATNTYSLNPVSGLAAARPMWFGDYGANGAIAFADPTTKTKMALIDLHSATGTATLAFTHSASRTLTFADPGGNDSMAYLAATQTFTGKTLTAPVIVLPTPTAAGATLAPTCATSGTTILFGAASGEVVTLPAASSSTIGCYWDFYTSVTDTTNYNEIQVTGSNYLLGSTLSCTASACLMFAADGSSIKAIKMGQTTTNCAAGSWFRVTGISATQWWIQGVNFGSGTMVTPFTATP